MSSSHLQITNASAPVFRGAFVLTGRDERLASVHPGPVMARRRLGNRPRDLTQALIPSRERPEPERAIATHGVPSFPDGTIAGFICIDVARGQISHLDSLRFTWSFFAGRTNQAPSGAREWNVTVKRAPRPLSPEATCNSPSIRSSCDRTIFIPSPLLLAGPKPAGNPGPSSTTDSE
jgi:hypothetical protein